MKRRHLLYILYIVGALWGLVIISSGAGLDLLNLHWNFNNMAELGESFGLYAAIAAGLAAYFTFVALEEARTERSEFKNDQIEQKKVDLISRLDDNFYRLLDLRRSLLDDLNITHNQRRMTGTDAIQYIVEKLSVSVMSGYAEINPQQRYNDTIRSFLNDSAHYLRFTYHIVKYIVDNYPYELRYDRIRILRALLSNSEQVLIALNCMYGPGQGQFKNWIEDYAILHNLSEVDKVALQIDQGFKSSAFELNKLAQTTPAPSP